MIRSSIGGLPPAHYWILSRLLSCSYLKQGPLQERLVSRNSSRRGAREWQVPGEGFSTGIAGRSRWWQEARQGIAVEVPAEGFTAGIAGRLRWCQEGRQGIAVQVPGEKFTAGMAGRLRW